MANYGLLNLFISNACAVRTTYSFLYADHGLSQSLRFLPKGSQARGTRLVGTIHYIPFLNEVLALCKKIENDYNMKTRVLNKTFINVETKISQFKEEYSDFWTLFAVWHSKKAS